MKNQMKLIIVQILALFVMSCGTNTMEAQKQINLKASDAEIAIKFLDDYVAYWDNRNAGKNLHQWIRKHSLLTATFKKSHKKILKDAQKANPESGLGFDPIFNAQDYPGGFVIKQIENTGFVSLQGKDWPEFLVTVKLVYSDGKWLVDGAGIINIPEEKQARRKDIESAGEAEPEGYSLRLISNCQNTEAQSGSALKEGESP